jgi:hypothetical protein
MKKALIIIGVVVAGLILVGYLNQPKTVAPSASSEAFYRESFMEGCVGEGANEAYCGCTYDRLEDLYGISGLIDRAEPISRGEFNKDEKEIIIDCSALL